MGYESRIYVVAEYKFDYGEHYAYNWDKPIETESGITHEPYRKSDGICGDGRNVQSLQMWESL